jgi:class 3 adenylate cyclase/tetratricopeptide (TPR) repeat protein
VSVHCRRCQSDNPQSSRFCLQCGAGLGAACRGCGAELPAGARFCNQCGTALAEAAASVAARERSPRDYTPKHLADKILTQKSALEGERKQVTVLFADVKGSLDMQESVDAEEWHRIMDRFFQILAAGVHRFEGTINQYTGDGIMALFGAPIAHEDHAQRACYAALHLSDALRDYARELRRERGLDFSTRMGINSGEVVVGKIGDDLRMDYTAQGQTVGLAARMEALAESGKVYLTGQAAAPVKGYFELDDLGAFHVKGVSEPVPVFELRGVGALRTRFDVSRARGLSRFVGRDADLKVLASAFESAKQGKGRALGLVADPGVGKSRLCFEFAERCRANDVVVLQGSGVPHGKNIPLLPILEIFRAYFGISERDEPRDAREKVAGRLLLIDDTFREVLPLVFEFLGIPDPQRPAPPLDPQVRQRRLVAVVRRLIERGNPNGFVILIEDLHWLDQASATFVAEYVDAIANGPGLLLLNFRPEYRADWMNKTWYQQLPLNPLGPDAIRELLHDLLGDDPSVSGLAGRIHKRTQGNPYFTEEIVRSLIESGALQGTRGSYRLSSPVEALDVPFSVHAVLSARIDRLPEREKLLLQNAAVIGKEFSEPILARVSELGQAELASALAALCNAEFIHQQSLYPIATYAFAHPLTQEVALASQLQEQRRRTHAAVAQAIRDGDPERLDDNAALLAHHYEEADAALDAAHFHARAAHWAGTKDLDGSLRHWQRVRELVRSLPESDVTARLRLNACLQILVLGGFRMGLSEAAVDELYAEASELAERSAEHVMLTTLRAAYGARISGLGRSREYYELSLENLKTGDATGIPSARAGVRVAAAYASSQLGRFEECLRWVEEGEEITGTDLQMGRREFGFSYRVFFAQMKASIQRMMGRLGEAEQQLAKALRVARDSGIPENLGWALGSVGYHALDAGGIVFAELGDAKAGAAESLRIAEELGSRFSRGGSLHNLGNACLAAGDHEEAARFFSEALELVRTLRVSLEFEPLMLAGLSRSQLGVGKTTEAVRSAEEGVAIAQDRGQRGWEVSAQLALAAALAAGRGARARAAAEAALRRAEELVEETGARVHAPWIAEVRARLAQAGGDALNAEGFLREAQRLYAQVGAAGHARRVAGELAPGGSL